jgi:hypothetical protein
MVLIKVSLNGVNEMKTTEKLENYKVNNKMREKAEDFKLLAKTFVDWVPRSVVDQLYNTFYGANKFGHDTIGMIAYLVQTGVLEARYVKDKTRYAHNNERLEIRYVGQAVN